jgi:hypothetical protein
MFRKKGLDRLSHTGKDLKRPKIEAGPTLKEIDNVQVKSLDRLN